MKFKDLENGMAIKFSDGKIGMVYKGFMTYNYIIADSGEELFNYTDHQEELNQTLKAYGAVQVRSVKNFCNDDYLKADIMFSRGEVIWTSDVTEEESTIDELTLEQVCEELGRDIKIVKG